MRSTFAIVLMMMAGCGRLGFDDGSDGGNGFVMPPATAPQQGVPLVAQPGVCQTATFAGVTFADPDVDLAVTGSPGGMTVVWTRTAGGSLHAVNIAIGSDGSLGSAGSAATIVSGSFTATSVTYIDNTLVAAVVSSSRVLLDTVPMTLAAGTQIGNVDGVYVGKAPILVAGSDLVSPTSCSSGLNVTPFDAFTDPGAPGFTAGSAASSALTAVQDDAFAAAAWSATDGCHVEQIESGTSGTETHAPTTCPYARLAAQDGELALAYEGSDGIYTTRDPVEALASTNSTKLVAGTSPRVVSDGTRYWLSWLDASGAIQAGYADDDGMLHATAVTGTLPDHAAYELAAIDDQVIVVSADSGGLTASRLCILDH